MVQVETAVVQPLKDAVTEEQWVQRNASLAAEAKAQKQAEQAAEQERQVAQAEIARQQAAEEAEALRQSRLTKAGPHTWLLAGLLSRCRPLAAASLVAAASLICNMCIHAFELWTADNCCCQTLALIATRCWQFACQLL